MKQKIVKSTGRRYFTGSVQLVMMLIAGAGLSLAVYQQFIHPSSEEDRTQIDFAVVDGVVKLPERAAGSAKLSGTTIRRSGSNIIISCLLVSPQKNIKIEFRDGSATTADGTKIQSRYVNIGKTSWEKTYRGEDAYFRPGIPVSVQWKMSVPDHHRSLSLIELVLRVDDVFERISYRNVAVPSLPGTVEKDSK